MLTKIKNNYFILISTVLFLYFFFNLLDGERGLISYFEKKNILKELKDERKNVVNKINKLEIKNSLLTDNLDLDYIEILIRQKFLFGKSGENTYMKMGGANVGLGLGMKNIRIVFTFKTKKAFDNFKENGWLGGAQADATAKSKQKGGANDVQVDTSGTHTYVMTNEGVALQASIQGSKYWKDDTLN